MRNSGVSIVIATKGRVRLLGELLESLQAAIEKAPCPCEIILVDDSDDRDTEGIRDIAERYNARIISFGPSVSAKRNKGAEESNYDIILFLDSDCLATPDLICEHYIQYTDASIIAVAGLLEFTGADTWFWNVVAASPYVMWFSFPKHMPTVPWAPTANCSVLKERFLEVGGFDTGFPNKPGGEDVDLGLRLQSDGKMMKCNPKALVYHQKETWQSPKGMMKRLWNYGVADCYLMERHPEILFPTYPRKTLLYIGLVVLGISLASTLSPLVLAVLLGAILIDLMLTALFMNKYEKKGISFLQQIVTQLLLINNEAGFIWGCLKRRRPKYLFRQLIYLDGQAYGTADRGALLSMAHAISLLTFVLVVLALF